MRILHGPVNVGNQPWVLSRYERELGHKSELVVNFLTWPQYRADRVLSNGNLPGATWNRMRRLLFAARSVVKYDVIHYYFGQSYFYRSGVVGWKYQFADLKLARAMGKRVFMTLQGCDIRQAAMSNARNSVTMCREGGCNAYSLCIETLDAVRQHLADEILPLCDKVFFLNPELGHDARRGEFMPYASVDIHAIGPSSRPRHRIPIVLHAPSDPTIKGTALIEAALNELSSRIDFEYRVVKGQTHEDAMLLYQEADLVIDQVQAGWYGGLAVEAMAMGKPVAAYIRDDDLKFIPEAMRADLPILRVDPENLTADLEQIFSRRQEWPDIGARSRAFVERWHDPRTIARALVRCYEDPNVPLGLGA